MPAPRPKNALTAKQYAIELKRAKEETARNKLAARMEAALKAAGLPEPEREVRFHENRMWRFDYCYPERKIALELHGGTYTQGRHTRGAGFAKDREKIAHAQLLGWIVVEATTDTVERSAELVRQAWEARV